MAQVTAYNLTIDDTSPQIVYSPPTYTGSSPDIQSTWNQYFDGVGFNTFPGQVGLRNESLHITQTDGANFSIAFTGQYSARPPYPPLLQEAGALAYQVTRNAHQLKKARHPLSQRGKGRD